MFALLVDGRLDLVEDCSGLGRAVYAFENREGTRIVTVQSQKTRCLGHQQYEQEECTCRERLREEHAAPADVDHSLLYGLGRIAQIVAYEIVHEIYYQHAEYYGELVARYQRAAYARGRDLGYVHRAYGRCQTDAYAADYTVEVERHEQRERCLAVWKYSAFGPPRAHGRYK